MIAHLNRCEDCYEIVSDTMRFLEQDEEEEAAEPAPRSRRVWLPFSIAAGVLLAALLAPLFRQLGEPNPWDQEREWVAFGLLAADAPLSARARTVFERVAQTFAFAETLTPRPLLIKKSTSPQAMALADGTIVITRGALDLCYRDVPPEAGDARLAYVLGHEVDHLLNGEDLHAFVGFLLKDARPGGHPEPAELERNAEKELRADKQGLVHAVLAGYDPRLILNQSEEFFQQWVSQPIYLSRPEPRERALQLRRTLDEVRSNLQEFQAGIRYYQLARYDLSIHLWERFLARFPSREVYSNLGLAHFQKAALELSQCDGSLLLNFFRFPLQIDTEALADARINRGFAPSSPCFDSPRFQASLAAAQSNFEKARSTDPSYLPALLNLVSAHLLARHNEDAFLEAEDASHLAPGDYRVQWVGALCRFAIGQDRNQATEVQAALEEMQRIRSQHSQIPEIVYDLAVMLDETRQPDQARSQWEAFVAQEPYGPYAEHARARLGLPPSVSPPALVPPPSPLPLGSPSPQTQSRLQTMKVTTLNLGNSLAFSVFEDDRLRVIARDGLLDLLVERLNSPLSAQEALDRFGLPRRRVRSLRGEFWDYSGFAVDLLDGSVSSVVHYRSARDRR